MYSVPFSSVSQPCLTLCDPMNQQHARPPCPSPTHIKAIKERKSEVKLLSRVRLFATPWTVAYQAPQSMEFSRQEYWSGLPFRSPGDLPKPGIKPGSPARQADALLSEPPGKPNKGNKSYFKI